MYYHLFNVLVNSLVMQARVFAISSHLCASLIFMSTALEKLQSTGWNLGWVFNSRSGCMCAMHWCCYEAKQSSLKLKTHPKQLLGYLCLASALPRKAYSLVLDWSLPRCSTLVGSMVCMNKNYFKKLTVILKVGCPNHKMFTLNVTITFGIRYPFENITIVNSF